MGEERPPEPTPPSPSPTPAPPQGVGPEKPAAAPPPAGGSLLPLLVVGLLVLAGLLASGVLGEKQPDAASLEALLAEGRSLLESRGPQDALPLFRRAHEEAPDDPRTSVALAQVLVRLQSFREAIPYLDQGLLHAPKDAELRQLRGSAYLSIGKLEPAQADLEEAARLSPDDPRPLFALSLLEGIRQDHAAGERRLRAYLAHPRVTPQQREVGMDLLAGVLDLQGRGAEGTAVLSSLSAMRPQDVVLRRRVDQRRIGAEGFAAVLDEAQAAASRPEATPAELLRCARLLVRDPARRAGARALLERAVELDRKEQDVRRKLGGWPQFALATEALRAGQLDPARLLLEEALQIDPGLTEARFFRVGLLRRRGEFAGARAELERFLDSRELGFESRMQLVRTWLEEGLPEKALEEARGQAEGKPPEHPAQLLVVAALTGAGQLAEAAERLATHREAVPEGPARLQLDAKLGELYLAAGEAEKARAAYERVLKALEQAPRRAPDLLLWAGVAWLPADAARARALWTEAADTGQPLAPEALATFGARRLLGRATSEELGLAASVSSLLEEQNDAAFLEGLALELAGDAAGARTAYQSCLDQSKALDFPARLAQARLAGLPK